MHHRSQLADEKKLICRTAPDAQPADGTTTKGRDPDGDPGLDRRPELGRVPSDRRRPRRFAAAGARSTAVVVRGPAGRRASGRAPTAAPLTVAQATASRHRRRRGRRGCSAGSCRSQPSRSWSAPCGPPSWRPSGRGERERRSRPSSPKPCCVSFACCRPVLPVGDRCPYPPRARSIRAARRVASAAASRSGRRVLTSQYGVGSAGSAIVDPHRALEVGPQQQVGPGVGVDARRAGGSPRRRGPRPRRAWSTAIRARPARSTPSRDRRPGRAP